MILPLTVLRRLDSVLEPTKDQLLKRHEELRGRLENVDPVLMQVTGHGYNTSAFTFPKLLDDPQNVGENLRRYILGFDPGTYDVIAKFELEARRSAASSARTCCTRSCRSSATSTCTQTASRTSRWATSTRS